MGRIKNDELQSVLEKKGENFSVRITTFISGSIKNEFIHDCIQREDTESRMAAHILDVYYSIVKAEPTLRGMGTTEMKNYLSNKFRL